MNESNSKGLLIDKLSFNLSADYQLRSADTDPQKLLFTPFLSNSTLEKGKITKDDLVIDIFVDNLSSWVGIEEYVFSTFFKSVVLERRKYFLFRDTYPAVIVQSSTPYGDDLPAKNQRRSKTFYLTISIMLTHAMVITFQAEINSSSDWDEVHKVLNSMNFSNPLPQGKLKFNACVSANRNVEMILPSVFCTTYVRGHSPIPRMYTNSLFNKSNLIFEVFAPHFLREVYPAAVYCGFSLYSVYSEDLPSFIEKYQNEHAPAPEKLDQNLKVNNMLCRLFHFKCDEHTFMDCIFQHPEYKKEVLIFSIFVDRFVSSNQLGIYVSSLLKSIESFEFSSPIMSSVKTGFFYESTAHGFSMYLPSDSMIIENPVPLSSDCIVSISSLVVLTPKFPKGEISGASRTRISKFNREVPEEEEPDPENLAKLKRDQLVKLYPEDCVSVGILNEEWSTRYTTTRQDMFVVGTYIFYNASEIYLFETEVQSRSNLIDDQVICLHNTITFK